MKRNWFLKSITTLILTIVVLSFTSTAFAITNIAANTSSTTHKYSTDWEWWSQGASKNDKLRTYGCHVVALSKLLVECGAASSDVNVFNPDIFWDWAYQNGYFDSGIRELGTGKSAIKWAANNGITLTLHSKSLSGSNADKAVQVMDLINQGYYCILHGSAHQSYVGRNASLNAGEAILLNSWQSASQNNGTRVALRNYTSNKIFFDTVYYYSVNGNSTPTSVLDVNSEVNGGIYSGNTEGMATFDVYINNNLIADDVTDFWKEIPQGSSYAITDIKPTNPNEYHYAGESGYWGTIGESSTNVYLHFVTPHVFDVNGKWNDIETGDTVGGCTFDVYINDVLMAGGWSDYYGNHLWGSTYRITDIKSLNPEGFDYIGETEYSGTIYDDTKVILPFATAWREVDLNGLLDGEDRGWLNGIATADVYINGELIWDDTYDYISALPYGTEYLVNDIKLASDEYIYVGPSSFSGTVGMNRIDVRLQFISAKRLELPADTKIIESEAFANVHASVIVLPNQATTIGERAFVSCSGLERIVIPESVTSIADNAFEGCGSITIICKPGSTAETFAKDNHLSYAELRTN